jgi:hypothetical protein
MNVDLTNSISLGRRNNQQVNNRGKSDSSIILISDSNLEDLLFSLLGTFCCSEPFAPLPLLSHPPLESAQIYGHHSTLPDSPPPCDTARNFHPTSTFTAKPWAIFLLTQATATSPRRCILPLSLLSFYCFSPLNMKQTSSSSCAHQLRCERRRISHIDLF